MLNMSALATVKDYPIVPEDIRREISSAPEVEETPTRRFHSLPDAYIGVSLRPAIRVAFSSLMVASCLCLVVFMIVYPVFLDTVSEIGFHAEMTLCFAVCLLDITISFCSLKLLTKPIVKGSYLCLVQSSMICAIFIHIAILVLVFLGSSSYPNAGFSTLYWSCFSQKSQKCTDVRWLGMAVWSTGILFLLFLIAWKISICRNPEPIDLDHIKQERKNELSKVYRRWQRSNQLNRDPEELPTSSTPYMPHFPKADKKSQDSIEAYSNNNSNNNN